MANTPHSNFLHVVQDDEFLPPISRWMTLSGLFLTGFVGAAITLAAFTPYKDTIKAPAEIRPAGRLRTVDALTEGQIMEIYVKEGDSVKEGQLIAILDRSDLQTQKRQKEHDIELANQQLSNLDDRIADLDKQIQAETKRTQSSLLSARAEYDNEVRNYRDRQSFTQVEVSKAEANLEKAQQELEKARIELQSLEEEIYGLESSLEILRRQRDDAKEILSVGAISKNYFERLQLDVNKKEEEIASRKNRIERQKITIKQKNKDKMVAKDNLKYALSILNPSDGKIKISQQKILEVQVNSEITLATLNQQIDSLKNQKIEVLRRKNISSSELKIIEQNLEKKSRITSPEDGIIFNLNLLNRGQSVKSGETVTQIIPNDSFVAIAKVKSSDGNNLKEYQNAHIKINSCPYPDYGILKGKVTHVTKDTQKSQGNGMISSMETMALSQGRKTFYQVTIELEGSSFSQGKNRCALKFGYEGEVDIVSRKDTILKFLLRKAKLITGWSHP